MIDRLLFWEQSESDGIPNTQFFYERENLGLDVGDGSCDAVDWHRCFVVIQQL